MAPRKGISKVITLVIGVVLFFGVLGGLGIAFSPLSNNQTQSNITTFFDGFDFDKSPGFLAQLLHPFPPGVPLRARVVPWPSP